MRLWQRVMLHVSAPRYTRRGSTKLFFTSPGSEVRGRATGVKITNIIVWWAGQDSNALLRNLPLNQLEKILGHTNPSELICICCWTSGCCFSCLFLFVADSWELVSESHKLMDRIFQTFLTGMKEFFSMYSSKTLAPSQLGCWGVGLEVVIWLKNMPECCPVLLF